MSMVLSFEKNVSGRDFVVGDVHGHFTKLQAALDSIGFNGEVDRLFSVGDLVDRGPESDLSLEWLDKPWFHAVRGNHEQMAIDWAEGQGDASMYLANGGAWNLANPKSLQVQIADAFCAMPLAIEVETEGGLVGIVHADCPFRSWGEFKKELERGDSMERYHVEAMTMWNRQRIEMGDCRGVEGLRAMVVGHTPNEHGVVLGNVHHIDTGAWLGDRASWARFTILDLATLNPFESKWWREVKKVLHKHENLI